MVCSEHAVKCMSFTASRPKNKTAQPTFLKNVAPRSGTSIYFSAVEFLVLFHTCSSDPALGNISLDFDALVFLRGDFPRLSEAMKNDPSLLKQAVTRSI